MDIPAEWTFKSASVAEGFDHHVREQLPWYDLASGATAHIARHYIQDRGLVYDVGASTGNFGRLLESTCKARNARLIAIDSSENMIDRYSAFGEPVVSDALDFDYETFDVCIMFLVLMFIPIRHRHELMRKVAQKIGKGGALIVVDKVIPMHGWAGTIMRRLTLAGKVATSTPSEDIIAKELSLAGYQRPVDETQISFLPGYAGSFFRFGEFAGWLVEG